MSTSTARDPCAVVIGSLEAGGCDPRPTGSDSWEARCPSHDGSRHNLTVSRAEDGKALVCCHHSPGCSTEAIVAALGLKVADLYPPHTNGYHANGNGHHKPGFATLDEARRWMAGKLDMTVVQTWTYVVNSAIVLAPVRFQDAAGKKTFRQAHRTALGWTWKRPPGLCPLYHHDDLADATLVIVCEGEKAADKIRSLGLTATTSSQGAKSADKTDWSALAGKSVIFIPDNDDEGEGYVRSARRILSALPTPPASIRIIRLNDLWQTDAEIIKGADAEEWLADGIPESWDDTMARDFLLDRINEAFARGPEPEPEPEPDQTSETNEPAFDFGLIDSAALDAAEYPRTFLVEQMLVEGQPAVVGGPRKALKTSVLVALALSLASGLPFLGNFAIPRRRRVMLLSGESGHATIQETARRVARAMETTLAEQADTLLWGFKLPQLSRDDHLTLLGKTIRERQVEVAVVDPLYLTLLAGGVDVSAANMFQMGPLLLAVTQTCLDAGATPILCHHFRQNRDDPYRTPELEDLAFAGVQEFARQWLLLGRRTAYEHGTGHHELWLNAGGSAGHGGAWAVDIEEGVVDDDFNGRFWDVKVENAGKARETAKAEREDAREKAKTERDEARQKAKEEANQARVTTDATAVASLLRKSGPMTTRAIRDGLAWGPPRANQAIARAIEQGWIRATTVTVKTSRYEREEQGYEHVPDA